MNRQRAGGSDVGRRLGGRVFIVALLSALVVCIADVHGAAGQLPGLPSVQPPSLPTPPKLVPPPQVPKAPVQVPDVPQARLPSSPRVEVPPVRVPSTPSAPSTPSRGVSPAGGTGSTQGATRSAPTSGGSSARSGRVGTRSNGPRARRRPYRAGSRHSRTGRHASTPTLRERRFRHAVVRLWACSYSVSAVQRRVLVLRTGLGGGSALSVKGVAKALSVSSGRVVRAQRAGLRGLRRANRSDGCALGSPQPAIARDAQAFLTVATAPPLASVEQFADAAAGRAAPRNSVAGAVLGERVVSSGTNDRTRLPLHTAAAVPISADAGSLPLPLLLIVFLLVIAAAGLVLLRQRVTQPQRATTQPVAAAAPVVAEPARPTRVAEALPPPPGPSYPPVSPPGNSPASNGSNSPDVRRAAGVAASGAASVLLGLALRARRRR